MKTILLSLGFLLVIQASAQWIWVNPSITPYDLNRAVLFPDGEGYAIGDAGTVICTTDYGLSWEDRSPDLTFPLRALFFFDEQTGLVAGDDGWMCRTTDGGLSWTVTRIYSEDLTCMAFLNDTAGFVFGDHCCLKTEDAGLSWNLHPMNYNSFVGAASFPDEIHGWVIGNNPPGWLLHTSDGGETWQVQDIGAPSGRYLTDIHFSDALHGCVVANQGRVYLTSDGGLTWSDDLNTRFTEANLNAVAFPDDNHGWVAGELDEILYTIDGGATWNPEVLIPNPNTTTEVTCLCFWESPLTGFATGPGGSFWVRDASSDIWDLKQTGTEKNLNAVSFVSALEG